ncbi:hypothetical protein [uncultured Tateyamaria sp.]|uniref:GTPase domain-containing protein n=1 Tax=uncultured Tateyamaria sp. TaxID=455651 RepID=UPI002628FD84|nr:hypothetical protein [uncultured Tateyamaria sp.]
MIDPTPYVGPAYELYKGLREKGVGRSAHSRFRRTINWIKSGNTQVAIFGAGGTGKSTLGKLILSGDPSSVDPTYDMSDHLERINLPGERSAQFLIVPGQADYQKTEWRKAYDRLNSARSLLVINVVAYGLHAVGGKSELEREAIPDEFFGADREAAYATYAKDRLQTEQELHEAVLSEISGIKKPIRYLTIVTKENLWWRSYDQVRQHYGAAYTDVLRAATAAFAKRGVEFSYSFLPVAQTHSNLVVERASERAVLKSVAEGYDMALHLASVARLLDKFDELIGLAAD